MKTNQTKQFELSKIRTFLKGGNKKVDGMLGKQVQHLL